MGAISALCAPGVASMNVLRSVRDLGDDGERQAVEVVVESSDDDVLTPIAQSDDEPNDLSGRELHLIEGDDVRFGIDEIVKLRDGLEANGGLLETFAALTDAPIPSVRSGVEELEPLTAMVAAEPEIAQERLGLSAEHRSTIHRDDANLRKRAQCHELSPG